MPKVRSTDGFSIHYEVHDFTDPWAKAPVLLLQHGFSRTARNWYNTIPYLSRHYRVVCPTFRGFGESAGPVDSERGFTIEQCLDDIGAVIADVTDAPVHFVGESLGGILGFALAATRPQRLRTLTVMSSPLWIRPEVEQAFAFGHGSWIDAMRSLGLYEWAKKANGATRFPPGTNPDLIEWCARETGRNDVEAMVAQVRMALGADARPLLEHIKCPVLGLYASASAVATDEQQAILKAKVPQIRIVHLPTAYHMVWMLFPAVCARHALHFAAAHDGIAIGD